LQQQRSRDEVNSELALLRKQEQQYRAQQKEMVVLQHELITHEKAFFSREQSLQREIAAQGSELMQKKHAATVAYQQASTIEKQLRAQKEQLLAEQTAINNQLKVLEQEIMLLGEQEHQYGAFKARFEKRKSFYTTYVPRLRWLQGHQEELLHKVALVNDESSSCPLCDQMLSAKRKQFLQEKLHKQTNSIEHQYNRLKKILEQLKKILVDDHGELKKYEALIVSLQTVRNQQEVLLARNAHAAVRLLSVDDALIAATAQGEALAGQMQKSVHECQVYAEESAGVIAHDSVLLELRARIQECGKRIEAARQSEHAYAALEQSIAALEQQRDALEEYEKRKAELLSMRQQLGVQKNQLQIQGKELAAKQAQCEAQSGIFAQMDECEVRLAQSEAEYKSVQERKEAAAQQYGQLTQARVKLDQRQVLMQKRHADIARLDSAYDDCMTLAQAWSKNGVQALLIDQAIPEIEHEANALLSRLSNNQSHVFIESLRDLKRGGVRETLDIKIADAMGVRPYEMFSGGEAFRIDFALRVAISKLLARRAGAALQVLIIDEGFGSQDEEGLGRLMEALYAVQDDFAKIIVVTHLPAFKENFPVHFIVEKGASGSLVTVEQRG
jgi:exonuclease SbcC